MQLHRIITLGSMPTLQVVMIAIDLEIFFNLMPCSQSKLEKQHYNSYVPFVSPFFLELML